MAINSIGNNINITAVRDTNDAPATNAAAPQPDQSSPLSRPGVSTQDANFAASVLRTTISSRLPNAPTASAPQPPPSPALANRATFQAPTNNLLSNVFQLPNDRINNAQTSLAVNSANQLQTAQVVFKGLGTGTMFFGLPPSNPIPPTTTAQLPRVVLDPAGVLSYSNNANQLTADQRTAIQGLYAKDQVSRGNYAQNIQNLASSLTAIKNAGNLNSSTTRLINNTISSLGSAYNALANFNGPSPAPDVIYSKVGDTLQILANTPGVDKGKLNTATNILGIGFSNYQLNRLPVNGSNNPATTTRGPLAAFNANAPLAAAQGNPASVFGAGLKTYLASIGIVNVNPAQVNYQVDSANRLQAATVPLGEGAKMTILFSNIAANGPFPPTAANVPQIAFSGAKGARQYADVTQNSAATQAQLSAFYKANAGPRANYVQNLQNLVSGFQALQTNSNNQPIAVRTAISNSISALQNAISGLNKANPVIPNVLGLYQNIGDQLDLLTGSQFVFSATQRQALDTMNRSTLPIGLINYYDRPIVLSQPTTTP